MSSVVFRRPDWQGCLERCKVAAAAAGLELGIQLHNTSTCSDLEAAGLTGMPLSAHLPLLSDWQINLASRAGSADILACSAALMRQYRIQTGVMHCFTMTDME